jgi:hypothetical protein
MTKITGLGSGSISQKHGSEDPDHRPTQKSHGSGTLRTSNNFNMNCKGRFEAYFKILFLIHFRLSSTCKQNIKIHNFH